MQITINGIQKDVSNNLTLINLLTELKVDSKTIVVELNENIIKKTSYESTILNPNDKLEIVSFVGGG